MRVHARALGNGLELKTLEKSSCYEEQRALNLVANALSTRLKSGDVVLVGETEHHANIVPWQQLESRIGIQVIPIPVDVTDLVFGVSEELVQETQLPLLR